MPDAVAVQMAEIFAADIDFHRELRKGDTFSVVYEALTADGEPVTWNQGAGRVLAAEFVNGGKAHQALWYRRRQRARRLLRLRRPEQAPRLPGQPDGVLARDLGLRDALAPDPADAGARTCGVDYGAPTGTPVRAVGDGVVEFAGRQNGYGNVVKVQHGKERSTLYAHLSRIDVRKGQRVEQGQRIGAVGATGWATGPHLHFEFQVNGQHQDPLSIAKAAETRDASTAARAPASPSCRAAPRPSSTWPKPWPEAAPRRE